jgi:hypothetical protein
MTKRDEKLVDGRIQDPQRPASPRSMDEETRRKRPKEEKRKRRVRTKGRRRRKGGGRSDFSVGGILKPV